jgi:hypothetical protein
MATESTGCEMIMIDSIAGHHHTDANFTVKVKNAVHFKELYDNNKKKKKNWLKRIIGR